MRLMFLMLFCAASAVAAPLKFKIDPQLSKVEQTAEGEFRVELNLLTVGEGTPFDDHGWAASGDKFGAFAARESDGAILATLKAPVRHVMLHKVAYSAAAIGMLVDRWAYDQDKLWYDWGFTGLEGKPEPLGVAPVPDTTQPTIYYGDVMIIHGDNNVVEHDSHDTVGE